MTSLKSVLVTFSGPGRKGLLGMGLPQPHRQLAGLILGRLASASPRSLSSASASSFGLDDLADMIVEASYMAVRSLYRSLAAS